MRIFWIRKRFFAFMVGILIIILLFVYFNKGIDQNSKILNKRILTDVHRDQGKGISVAAKITTASTPSLEPCAGITMPNLVKQAGFWQPVQKDLTAYIFSAYFIHETKKIVIIALRRQVRAGLYFCQFWCKGEGNQYVLSYNTHAKLVRLPEGHGQSYSAILFECPVQSSPESLPTYVSIVDKNCTAPLNILLVQHVTKPEAVSRNFTLCLSPLYGNPSIYRIVEWLEFNILLGADHLFVYNYSSNKKLQKVLKYYYKKGFVTIIHWNLPESGKEVDVPKPISVHYFGQVAALNDCLYRNKYESEFIVNVDLDEFIIPHVENDTTWHQMLSHVNQNEAAYIVRNTFFKEEWDNANIEISNKTLVEKYKLITLLRLQHEKKIFLPGLRSKYFARTSRAHSVMIHTGPMIYNFPIPVNIALLHHYRDFETKDDLESSKVLDRTVPNKFGNVLIQKVVTVWSELNKTLSDSI